MKRILLGMALAGVATSAKADKIVEILAKKPEFSAQIALNLYDVDRCSWR
jgi:hypothetical protein